MSYSYYEIYNNALRAFRGLDFPYGADEDAAYIITWLEFNNLDGIKILASNLNKYDQSYNGIIDNSDFSNNCFDLKSYSTLMVGPNIIDYIIAKIKKNEEQVLKLKNCSFVIFLIPLLVKLLNKKIYCIIKNKKNIIGIINNKNISISSFLNKNIDLKNDFLIHFNNNETKKNLDINIKSNTFNKKLSTGTNPKNDDWKKVSKIAYRTYVPESNKSRIKGAGGGDDND